jgi:hypothetical protein
MAQPPVSGDPKIPSVLIDRKGRHGLGNKAVLGLIYLRDLTTLDQNQTFVSASPYLIRIHNNA